MRRSKPIRLTLEPRPAPKPGRPYPGLVKDVSLKKQSIVVTVENLDKNMAGCLQCVGLPKSLHPGNKTHRFAKAAGLDIETLGAQIDLRDSIGAIVNMRFIPAGDNYEIEFEKVSNSEWAERGCDNPPKRGEKTPASDTVHDC